MARIVMPKSISQRLWQFQLPREAAVMFHARVRDAERTTKENRKRYGQVEFFTYIVSFEHAGVQYMFDVLIDDATSDEHLIVKDITLDRRPKPKS